MVRIPSDFLLFVRPQGNGFSTVRDLSSTNASVSTPAHANIPVNCSHTYSCHAYMCTMATHLGDMENMNTD